MKYKVEFVQKGKNRFQVGFFQALNTVCFFLKKLPYIGPQSVKNPYFFIFGDFHAISVQFPQDFKC